MHQGPQTEPESPPNTYSSPALYPKQLLKISELIRPLIIINKVIVVSGLVNILLADFNKLLCHYVNCNPTSIPSHQKSNADSRCKLLYCTLFA